MKLHNLTEVVERRIEACPDAECDSPGDTITLSIPEPRSHNGERVRLFGRRGPMARVLGGARGHLTVHVSARRLREWLTNNGLWEVRR